MNYREFNKDGARVSLLGYGAMRFPTDENGKYVWIEIKGVEIVEIVNYNGK